MFMQPNLISDIVFAQADIMNGFMTFKIFILTYQLMKK